MSVGALTVVSYLFLLNISLLSIYKSKTSVFISAVDSTKVVCPGNMFARKLQRYKGHMSHYGDIQHFVLLTLARTRTIIIGVNFLQILGGLMALSPPLPSSPLRHRAPKIQLGVWGSAVSSHSGVWGRAPAEIKFGAF